MSTSGFALVPFLVGLTPGAGLLVLGLVVFVRKPSPRSLDRWASRFGLPLPEIGRSLVAGYLRRTRGMRIIGAGVGWLVSPVVVASSGQGIPLLGVSVFMAIAGYILGASIAETVFAQTLDTPSEVRSASLARRILVDYAPTLSTWSLRILATVAIALGLLFAAMPRHPQRAGDPSLALVIGSALLMAALALVVERILQRMVDRPQPAVDADLLAADDAIRASAIQSLSGAGVGLLLVGIGAELFWMQFTTSLESLRQLLGWPATVAIILALLSSAGSANPRSWRLRRSAG